MGVWDCFIFMALCLSVRGFILFSGCVGLFYFQGGGFCVYGCVGLFASFNFKSCWGSFDN